jgi:hypothetical protein
MHKTIYISFLLLAFFMDARAQQKFVYEDTALLLKDEPVSAPAVDARIIETGTAGNTDETVVYEEEELDTTLYKNNLYLPFDSVKSWKNLKDYAYTRYLDSLLQNKKQEVQQPVQRKSQQGILNRLLGSGFISALLWILAIAFVLFIIYRLFLAEGVFQRRSKAAIATDAGVEEELITRESDFDALIRQALQNGNFRQAVRYQYLRTLHSLANRNFIELSPDKTNFQYVQEIANHNHRQDFAALTLNYEYVWYGEFDIEKDIYQKIENGFINLNRKL